MKTITEFTPQELEDLSKLRRIKKLLEDVIEIIEQSSFSTASEEGINAIKINAVRAKQCTNNEILDYHVIDKIASIV